MSARTSTKVGEVVPWALVLLGLPLLIWATGGHPRRTVLKESLSVLTLLSFCLMSGQFVLARGHARVFEALRFGGVMRIHKIVGYTFVGVLLVHPFLIVLPRFFESGVDPVAAFLTMITTFDSRGVVLGITAWSLLLVLGITSLVRHRLPLKPRTWRILHGALSTLFVAAATWHAIDLGRYADVAMSVTLIVFAAFGAVPLLVRYVRGLSGGREQTHD